MYIGTSLDRLNGVAEKIDKLTFTYSIKPESIPFLDKYGVRVVATPYTLPDVANYIIPSVLDKLDDKELSISNIDTEGRTITANINYNNNVLQLSTTALLANEGGDY